MTNEMLRPCTLPNYWKAEGPIDASDIIAFGFNWGNEGILSFEAVSHGARIQDALPTLDLEELEEIQKWIDERYCSSAFDDIDTKDKEFLQLKYYRETAYSIQRALNPPIWVMDAVLEAVKKEPNAHYLILDKLDSPYYERSMDVDDIKRGDYIQADCPLALQVLLGFTTEGVPVND